MKNLRAIGGLIALCIGAFVWPSVASAVTYVQTSDDCNPLLPCGTNPLNTINITADGNNTQIQVTFAPNWQFVDTGANGTGSSFNFGFTSATTGLIFTAIDPTQWTTALGGFQVQGGTGTLPGSTETANSALIAASGKFSFTNGFAITCNQSGSTRCDGLTFDVNMSLAAFLGALATSNGSTFYADVISSNGNTGIVDYTQSTVPLPPAALLFGTALVGMVGLGRRRRERTAAS